MKKILTIALIISASMGFTMKGKKADGPVIKFEVETFDFGKIREGVIAEYAFKYTNTGNQTLVLTDVRPSCGCTTPDWSREPLEAGKSNVIKVKYNSAGRPGTFYKSITISSNIPDKTEVLYIKGEVIKTTDQRDPNQSPVRVGG